MTRRVVIESLATFSKLMPRRVSMRLSRHPTALLRAMVLLAVLFAVSSIAAAQGQPSPGAKTTSPLCPSDNSGLTLPSGFCATVFADHIGHARHMVVGPGGVVYVNTWSGEYYDKKETPAGGFLV